MKGSVYGLQNLNEIKDAQDIGESAALTFYQNQKFRKQNVTVFLDAIVQHLQSYDGTPISKTMTMHVIKEINYYSDSKFMSVLSTHKLNNYLFQEALIIDPKKRLEDKGKSKFPSNPDLGIQYMRVMLECLVFWGEKYARGSNDQPSVYKRNISDLKSKGIDLPKQQIYLDMARIQAKSKTKEKSGKKIQKPTPIPQQQFRTTTSKVSGSHLIGDLAFTKDKIHLFMGTLEEEDDDEVIRKEIMSKHKNFGEDLSKYTAKMSEVQNQQNQNLEKLFFKVHYFLEKQSQFYNAYIPRDDYQSYLTEMKNLYQTSQFEEKLPQSVMKQENVSKPRMEEQTPSFNKSNLKLDSKNQNLQSQPPQPPSRSLVNNLFSKLEERSKSPQNGFKSINKQLQKQKQKVRQNPLRRTSRSPVANRSISLSKSGTNIRDKINPIFSNPPNYAPQPKSYEGQTIHENSMLTKVLFNLRKDQGARRFKVSNLRDKNPLFENQHIQVGYKSYALYENIGGLNQFICVNIFLGNKTQKVIKNFKVEYKADSNQLLYANPKNVDSLIPAGYQNKHDLMIAPLKLPYSFMTMQITYTIENSNMVCAIIIPNSILKFASYMSINKFEFEKNWGGCEKIKTLPFQLCKHFPPDSLKKWIPALNLGSDYQKFAKSNSQDDLQYFCQVILQQKHEGILKISIRPNLKVIIQIGLLDRNETAREYFQFYLETLELIMKQIDV